VSYIVLRGRWFNIIVLNVHAPSEEKSDESKDSFYEELEQVFDHLPKYHMKILLGDFNAKVGKEKIFKPKQVFDHLPKYHIKILLGDFNAKVGKEKIFKPTIGNESLHQYSNDNGIRIVNFVTSKNLVVKSMMFPHRNIHKYTWTSPDWKTHNQIDHILIDSKRHSSILDVRSFRGADCDTDNYLVVAKLREN